MAKEVRTITASAPVIIEGVSALNPAIADLYALRLLVDSDPATLHDAALARGVGTWGDAWCQLFLPSVDIYMRTRPMTRADLIVAGRGLAMPPS